ncbi:MAG: hypothetical protein JJT94_14090 [Bernardetiaceae bacterium]|nr:hypothetical protein [Bernardetiaceae bacterium]
MKFVYLFLLTFFIINLQAQAQVVLILNSETQSPVEFADILYLNGTEVLGRTYSDAKGQADLELSDEVVYIEVSQVGYESVELDKSSIPDTIWMSEDITVLEAITVTPKNKTVKLGYEKPKNNRHQFMWSLSAGLEAITLIENPFSERKSLKSLEILLSRYDRTAIVLKVVAYKNKKGKPADKPIKNLKNNIFVLKPNKKKNITLDIEDIGIMLPKGGFFIGIEYIGVLDAETDEIITEVAHDVGLRFTSTQKKTGKYSYCRFKFKTADWSKPDFNDTPFWETDGFSVPVFSLEVYK